MKPTTFITLLAVALGLIFLLTGCTPGDQPKAKVQERARIQNTQKSIPASVDFTQYQKKPDGEKK